MTLPKHIGDATLVPFSKIPIADRTVIALCSESFADFLERHKVKGEHRRRVLEGGAYRAMGARLTSARHALLVKFDARDHFEITLDVWRELHVFRKDFLEVFKLLGVSADSIHFADGPVLWR